MSEQLLNRLSPAVSGQCLRLDADHREWQMNERGLKGVEVFDAGHLFARGHIA